MTTTRSNTAAFLTRFEASLYLQLIYRRYLKANKIKDTERPDWYSILAENRRDPSSHSAIQKGCSRGNRAAYGQIRTFRIGGRPYYLRDDLESWFSDNFESRIFDRSEAA